jgi:hypothetical protein
MGLQIWFDGTRCKLYVVLFHQVKVMQTFELQTVSSSHLQNLHLLHDQPMACLRVA